MQISIKYFFDFEALKMEWAKKEKPPLSELDALKLENQRLKRSNAGYKGWINRKIR